MGCRRLKRPPPTGVQYTVIQELTANGKSKKLDLTCGGTGYRVLFSS